MNWDIVLKVAGVGILVAITTLILDQAGKKELAQAVAIAGVVVVLYVVAQSIAQLFTLVKSVFQLY